MISKFIAGLARFYSYENDLSNITCLLCEISDDFKSKFLKFFFPDIEVSKVIYIEREVPDSCNKGCRVDIYVSMEDESTPYIIECKIYDRKHHFGDYDKAYKIPKERFGYITNYNCIEGLQQGYEVKTWESLFKYLSSFEDNDNLTIGYLEYLKETCNLQIYDSVMDISGLYAIPCFIDTATQIIEENRDWLITTPSRLYFDKNGLNKSFFFKYTNQRELRDGYALLGLWFQEEPAISICINSRDWLSERIMSRNDTIMEGATYCDAPYYDHYWRKDDVFFEMKDSIIKEFMKANSYEEQRIILHAFFDEAMHRISTCYNLK